MCIPISLFFLDDAYGNKLDPDWSILFGGVHDMYHTSWEVDQRFTDQNMQIHLFIVKRSTEELSIQAAILQYD